MSCQFSIPRVLNFSPLILHGYYHTTRTRLILDRVPVGFCLPGCPDKPYGIFLMFCLLADSGSTHQLVEASSSRGQALDVIVQSVKGVSVSLLVPDNCHQ